jgi:hypothetical protein
VSALPSRLLTLALAALLAGALPGALAAQRPLRATGVRGLTFGILLPGLPQPVLSMDAVRSAQLDVTGPNREVVRITFTLPSVLAGPAGGTIPIVFGATSAGWSESQTITNQVLFDPQQPFTATLSNNGRGSVFLGATLQPGGTAPSGAYSAPITITLALVGT